jgi:HK97 family phage major capsid protein
MMSAVPNIFVEFTEDVTPWKVGDINGFKPAVARGLIDAGQAKESDAFSHGLASLNAAAEKREQSLLEKIDRMLKPTKTPAGPPGGKELVQRIERTEGPEERDEQTGQKVKRTFGEFCKMVALYQGVDTPHQLRALAHSKLRDRYGAEKCDYEIDENTGEITQTVSRSTDFGIETITRTGTESLGGGPTYGFALKPEYMATLFEIPMEQSVFAGGTFGVPIGQALELKWPAMDQYNGPKTVGGITQSAVFANFSLGYVGETTARPSSDGKLSDIQFKIVDLTGFTDFSRDLLQDNYIAMDAMAQRIFGRAFVWMEDYMSIRGSGQGQPEGYFNSIAALGYDRGTASHIYYGDLVNMQQLLHPMCWPNARWIGHLTTLTELQAIQVSAGVYVYQPNALISQAMTPTIIGNSTYSSGEKITRPMGTLLGWPFYISEKVPTLGNTGDLSLVCPDQYGYARRAGLEVGLSEHFFFSTDRIAYRFKMRHDGKSLWRAPYIQADGTQSVSPFVVLLTHT